MAARSHWSAVWAVGLTLAACKGDDVDKGTTTAPVEVKDACKDAPDLGWLGAVAKDPALLEGAGGGWVAFYRRNYRAAAKTFSEAADDPTAKLAEARSHLRLGRIFAGLAQLTARAQADYFEARAELGKAAAPLRKGAYFRGVATVLGRDAEAGAAMLFEVANGKGGAPGDYRRLARAWPKSCDKPPRATTAWDQVAYLARCSADGLPSCPEKTGAPPYQDPWKMRVALYHAALCAPPDAVDETRLAELASSPVDSEPLKGRGGVEATIEYYDPVALWALGQLHLRRAALLAGDATPAAKLIAAWAESIRGDADAAKQALSGLDAAGLSGHAGLLLSDARTGADLLTQVKAGLGGPTAAAPKAEAALEAMRAAEAADRAAVGCVGSADGKKVVEELGLAPGFARAALRRVAAPWLADPKTCTDALRLLRSTQDIKNLEAVSYVNEPAFLVSLAEAALCMRRSAEAIGALKTVREAYPEAEAALAAAQGLSVVRLMGGTGGTQKIQ